MEWFDGDYLVVNSTIKIIEALTPLVQVVAWPGLIAFIIFRYSKPIGIFLDNLSVFKVKAAEVEISATREKIKAAALAGVASQRNIGEGKDQTPEDLDVGSIADAVYQFPMRSSATSNPTRILWVDDIPSNNYYPRCLLYTSPSPRDKRQSRMPSSA